MAGRAAKQSYLGRVIFPAKFHPGNNGKPYLTFTLYVDRLAVNKNKERVSGKFYCSYAVNGENDPVGHILCKVHNKENPNAGGLAGQQYKSVEVWVEGSEKLVEALDSNGQEVPGAYVKFLEFCTIQVVDSNVLSLYSAQFNQQKAAQPQQQQAMPQEVASSAPNVAPSPQPRQARAKQQQQVSTQQPDRTGYQVGDKLVQNGMVYELVSPQFMDASSWKLLGPAQASPTIVPPKPTPKPTPEPTTGNAPNPFAAIATTTSIKNMLEEEDIADDMPMFDSNKLPV